MPADDEKTAAIPLHRELQYINAKDGAFTEAEKKRLDVIEKILNAEPELRKTLVALDARQKKEIEDLIQKQRREPPQPYGQQTYGQQYTDLEKRHDKERERYISEHHAAKAIRADMEKQEKRHELERGMDGPKRTR